jgi:Fe-S cluster biogenesis protein NfuA
MANAQEEQEFRKRIQGIETLIQEVERFPDPAARARTQEIVQAILDLHGAGLARILNLAAKGGPAGLALIDAVAADELVGSLLLLYGLHPLNLETRVRQALDKVRPYLRSHGGNVELLGVGDGVVRLRMQGGCHGCPSSAMTLKLAIEEAIYEKAPDASAIEVEGVVEQPAEPPTTFVPLGQLLPVGDGRAKIALPLLHG